MVAYLVGFRTVAKLPPKIPEPILLEWDVTNTIADITFDGDITVPTIDQGDWTHLNGTQSRSFASAAIIGTTKLRCYTTFLSVVPVSARVSYVNNANRFLDTWGRPIASFEILE